MECGRIWNLAGDGTWPVRWGYCAVLSTELGFVGLISTGAEDCLGLKIAGLRSLR